MFCNQPFNRIEIYGDGNVYNCCPPFIKNYCIGNIFKTPFNEIWNGDKVKYLRKKILEQDYSLCSDICNQKDNNENNILNYTETVEKYPEEISISSDSRCNVMCKICRDENFYTEYSKENLETEINNIWLPIFKDTKLLRFGCSGEPFSSYKETMIIKKTAEKYPDIKFHFHTNGILADEKLLKHLQVFDKIDTMTVSLHSAYFWTYNKIVRGGNWKRVKSNLKLYSKMKSENIIKNFRLIFCVYSENYKDMPAFVKLAKKYNAIAEFWALRLVENTHIGKHFDEYSVLNPNHKEYNKFVRLINQPLFKDTNVILYPELQKLIGENYG